ncbi:SPOR domain-containing protein [Bacteroidales bacterium OttesenSCG-928-J19]|nr:SPOR domain-containing protein [Bacteroidales bacterium OttesenSCG-928-J19]
MQNLCFHLAYLLTKHECVIVPGLGAFIVNPLSVDKDNTGRWTCPGKTLSFNSQITHNEGLLANSIALEKGLSYKEASLLMKKQIDRMEALLDSGESVKIPWVGTLSRLSDSKLHFTPSSQMSCNHAYYGLKNIYLDPLSSLEQEEKEQEVATQIYLQEEQEKIKPFRWRSVVTTAAAVAALFLIALPMNNPGTDKSVQNASFVSFVTPEQASVEEQTAEIASETRVAASEEKTPERITNSDTRYYYIVIASLPSADLAEKKVLQYREGDFPQAAVVSKDDKHRVYVNRFEDKEEAESFLEQFREAYPKHNKAWLLAQRG